MLTNLLTDQSGMTFLHRFTRDKRYLHVRGNKFVVGIQRANNFTDPKNSSQCLLLRVSLTGVTLIINMATLPGHAQLAFLPAASEEKAKWV